MRKLLLLAGLALLALTLAGCGGKDGAYSLAEEHYFAGWVLHNVDESTETELAYGPEDVETQHHRFDLPGSAPDEFLVGNTWLVPFHRLEGGIIATELVPFPVEYKKTYYLFGSNPVPEKYFGGWALQSRAWIGYDLKNQPEPVEYFPQKDLFTVPSPVAGSVVENSFGGPYLPTSIAVESVDDGVALVMLKHPLLRGSAGNSVMLYSTTVTTCDLFSGECETRTIDKVPTYRLLREKEVVAEGKLLSGTTTDYHALYQHITEAGTYTLELALPSLYQLWALTEVSAAFTFPAEDSEPPSIEFVDVQPRFGEDEELLPIAVRFADNIAVAGVEIAYRFDGGTWAVPPVVESDGLYEALFTLPEAGDVMDVRFTAHDTSGNSVTYTVHDASHRAEAPALALSGVPETASRLDEFSLLASCTTPDGMPCRNMLVGWFFDDVAIGRSMADRDGKAFLEWQVPATAGGGGHALMARFSGAGVLSAGKIAKTFVIDVVDHDIGLSSQMIGPANEKGTLYDVNATLANLGGNDEADVEVVLSIDDVVMETKVIELLRIGETRRVSFRWAPKEEGFYDVAIAVTGEDGNPGNNRVSQFFYANFIVPDVSVFIDVHAPFVVDRPGNIPVVLDNYGERTAENVGLTLYPLFEPAFVFFDLSPGNEGGSGSGEGGIGEAEAEKEAPAKGKIPEGRAAMATVVYEDITYEINASREGETIALNISAAGFAEKAVLSDASPIRALSNGVVLFLDYDGFFGVDVTLGRGGELKSAIGDVLSQERKTKILQWTPAQRGRYMLITFASVTEDSGFRNNRDWRDVNVLRPGVNVNAALLVDYDNTFVTGETAPLNVSVENFGTVAAGNVRVSLYEQTQKDAFGMAKNGIPGKLVGVEVLKAVPAGEKRNASFAWTPQQAGERYLFALVEAKGDINPRDNDDLRFVQVLPGGRADVASFLYFPADISVAGVKQEVEGVIGSMGPLDAAQVKAKLYEITDKRRLVGEKALGNLPRNVWQPVLFNWTPSRSGKLALELVAEAANDGNGDNNADTLPLTVRVQAADMAVEIMRYPRFILNGSPVSVSVLLSNRGTGTPGPFNLTLAASGRVVDTLNIGAVGDSKFERFEVLGWTPKQPGKVTLEAAINLTDAVKENNVDAEVVDVFAVRQVNITVVDASSLPVERILVVGDEEQYTTGTSQWTLPAAPLEFWIGVQGDEGAAALTYRNATLNRNITITTAHTREREAQDSILLYELLAANASWAYDQFSGMIIRSLDTLDIRYTELLGMVCGGDFNFTDNSCDAWADLGADVLVSRGDLIVQGSAREVQAFALADTDYDGDSAPDWDDDDNDNDGIVDELDTFNCFAGKVRGRRLNITVNDSDDLQRAFEGRQRLKLQQGDRRLVETDVNFSRERVDCRSISVVQQKPSAAAGYTVVNGLALENGTKTLFVDRISGAGKVCVKDVEVESVAEVTPACTSSNEYIIACNGQPQNGYTCTVEGQQYRISGLKHSAVVEPPLCVESWSCTDWGSCSSSKQVRACSDASSCGTTAQKPAEEQSCGTPPSSSSSSGGGKDSGPSARDRIYELGALDAWSGGKTETVRLKENDLITFTLGRRSFSITLSRAAATYAVIDISSEADVILLRQGETKSFDIDKDGSNDLAVTFEESSFSTVTLALQRIVQEQQPKEQRTRQPVQTEQETPTPPPTPPARQPQPVVEEPLSQGSGFPFFALLVGVTLIAAAAAAVLIHRKKTLAVAVQERASAAASQIDAYVQRQLARGYPPQAVYDVLVKAGWPPEQVEQSLAKYVGKR